MGGVSSIPQNPNILDQIKNKDYSVININDKPNSLEKTSNIKVTELKNIRTISGTGACTPLPPSIVLKPGNSLNKNIFVSRVKGQHIRLYADRKCRKRANEEEYADLNPTDFPEDFPNYSLDYHFGSKPTDEDDKRETGVDRFPVSKNTKVVTKNTPITIYTDVLKDSGNNTIKDVNDNPTCSNIYSPAIVTGGFTLNDGHKPPTPDKQARYTPIPYTKVVNYGTSVANKTNSLYYSLRKEPGILE